MSLKNNACANYTKETDWSKEVIAVANSYISSYANPKSVLTVEDINRALKIMSESEYKNEQGEEEWVWVTGYKGTDKDMKCRDYQFEMNKQFDMPEGEEIEMCSSGFHFCDKLKFVYSYYNINNGNRFFEVKALVRRWKKDGYYKIEQRGDKMVAKSIKFVRELSVDEIFDVIADKEAKSWTTEQKELARQTSIETVRKNIKIGKLVKLGYSEAFATYACLNGAYDMACVMGETPNISMDVKVLTICMNMRGDYKVRF